MSSMINSHVAYVVGVPAQGGSRTTLLSSSLDAAGSSPHSSSRRRRQVVRQRSAKPPSPVQIRAARVTGRGHGVSLPSARCVRERM